jgi:hypothetical protein
VGLTFSADEPCLDATGTGLVLRAYDDRDGRWVWCTVTDETLQHLALAILVKPADLFPVFERQRPGLEALWSRKYDRENARDRRVAMAPSDLRPVEIPPHG